MTIIRSADLNLRCGLKIFDIFSKIVSVRFLEFLFGFQQREA